MWICENFVRSIDEQIISPAHYGLPRCANRAGLRSVVLIDETNFRLMRILAERPDISQRDLAEELGVSLGKVNYCLRALLEKSWVKAQNFRNSSNKIAYIYLLTPAGIEARSKLTIAFLKRKKAEYEGIRQEIDRLQLEVELQSSVKSKNPS